MIQLSQEELERELGRLTWQIVALRIENRMLRSLVGPDESEPATDDGAETRAKETIRD